MTNVTVRRARPNRDEGELFAQYFDVAGDGLMRWMLGKRFAEIIGKAYQAPGHDLSHEHVWFAELDGEVVGVLSGYSSSAHSQSRNGPMFRAAGIRVVRMIPAWFVAMPLFNFMDRIPDGDWYVQTLAVDPERRGAGIGSVLLDHAEQVAAAAGSHRLALDVVVDNGAAQRLYQRRGMAIEATSRSVPLVHSGAVHRMTKAL